MIFFVKLVNLKTIFVKKTKKQKDIMKKRFENFFVSHNGTENFKN